MNGVIGMWPESHPTHNFLFRQDTLSANGTVRHEADADRMDTVEKEQLSFWDWFELSRAASSFDGGFVADDFIFF
jgi:hypothetical protein